MLLAAIAYIGRFYGRLDSMSRIVSVTQKSASAAKRILDILDHVSSVPEPQNPVRVDRVQGRIELPCVQREFYPYAAALAATSSSPALPACPANELRGVPDYDLIGTRLARLTLASEDACARSCCAQPACASRAPRSPPPPLCARRHDRAGGDHGAADPRGHVSRGARRRRPLPGGRLPAQL
jgi:hypothetical protein